MCACFIVGPNCDTCAENYFGNPLVANSTCEPCLCNNNIDPNVDGSCDTSSGECLKCLFNTEGFSCEKCKPGYYGDATTQSCVGKGICGLMAIIMGFLMFKLKE